jgi:mono/diheme cytochrome c family protein
MRRPALTTIVSAVAVTAALALSACGEEGIQTKSSDSATIKKGAELFAARCSGCHTLSAAGAQGSAANVRSKEPVNGPNFDERPEKAQTVLYALRNGGFSGAIMPQNIVVGRDALAVAAFVAEYAGKDAKRPPQP